ncbi:MAG: hypothetical protein QXU34_05575 [Ignisphaera sp.]
MDKEVRIYRNEDVLRIVAFIPPDHYHIRLAIEFRDQVVVLHEATVAAIARAYIDIVTHPTRRAVEFQQKHVVERKQGYAQHQLVEAEKDENRIIEYGIELLKASMERDSKNSTKVSRM